MVLRSAVTGHAEAQAGSSQCMHWRFAKIIRKPAGASGSSTSWWVMSMYVLPDSVGGFWKSCPPVRSRVSSPGRSFHSLQITWQEWHPMHFVVSMSFA